MVEVHFKCSHCDKYHSVISVWIEGEEYMVIGHSYTRDHDEIEIGFSLRKIGS